MSCEQMGEMMSGMMGNRRGPSRLADELPSER
jgi:hypothetical protein